MAGHADRNKDSYLLMDAHEMASMGATKQLPAGSNVEQIGRLDKSQTHNIRIEKTALQALSSRTSKKRRWMALSMVMLYSAPLLLSWLITVVLSVRPLGAARWDTSYASSDVGPCWIQVGLDEIGWGFSCENAVSIMSEEQLALNNRWVRAVRLVGAVVAVLAMPISSAICARAAVAYLQGQKEDNSAFSVSRAMTLADRGWWDPATPWSLLHPQRKQLYFKKFVVFATVVCALGVMIWPLQALLVTPETAHLLVWAGLSAIWGPPDADIAGLSQLTVSDTIRTTRSLMESGSYWDSQPNIWRTDDSSCDGAFASWTKSCHSEDYGESIHNLQGAESFVSVVPNTVNTGLIEHHSFRFNTSIQCTNVTEDMLPRPCPGFTTSSMANLTDEVGNSRSMEFQICAPGDLQKFPWNVTRNRQDIEEEIYLHFNDAATSFLTNRQNNSSWTQRCTAQTSAGYSMLPNSINSTFGPLLGEFNLSASNDVKTRFHDISRFPVDSPSDQVLGETYQIPDIPDFPILGPLMTATVGLFGPSTFFSTRANATLNGDSTNSTELSPFGDCLDPLPFHYISHTVSLRDKPGRPDCASSNPSNYADELNDWLYHIFMDPHLYTTEALFTQSAFHANKAALSQAATLIPYRRMVLVDPGAEALLLRVSTASAVVISAVVFAHLAGLVALSFYALRRPTWTETLDAFAVLRLGMLIGDKNGLPASASASGSAEAEVLLPEGDTTSTMR